MAASNRDSEMNKISSSQTKLSEADIPSIQSESANTDIPIVMGESVYDASLADDQQCFVLMDDQTMGVMPGGSDVQRILNEEENPLTVSTEKIIHMMPIDNSKASNAMQVGSKETIEVVHMQDGKTVEVLHMDDGKTVEVVQMDGGKTLEVMHIDAGKHQEVIHVNGSNSNIDLLGVENSVNIPSVTSSSSENVGRKTKYVYASQRSKTITPMTMKRALTSESSHESLNLKSLTSVSPSVVISTGKDKILANREYARVNPAISLATGTEPHIMRTGTIKSMAHVNSNIVLSSDKEVLSGGVDAYSNTIIISWATAEPELENTVATQTEPYSGSGPSMNLFFCTFFPMGDAQTQCDMPVLCDIGVSVGSMDGCRIPGSKVRGSFGGGSSALSSRMEEDICDSEGMDPRYSRSGRILKRKGPMFKIDQDPIDGDRDCDPDFVLQGISAEDEEENMMHQNHSLNLGHRKKRGRKRKRRYPSDDMNDDLELSNTEDVETVKVEKVEVKDEPADVDEEELALEMIRTKGYGLRTKKHPKKLSDMHYIEEKVIKKRIERKQEFHCQICSIVFPTFTRLQRHAKDEHESTEFAFPCDLCGVVFTRPHNLERHKDTKHGDGEKRFVCDQCGRRFARQDVLSVHISMVHFKRSLQGKKGHMNMSSNSIHCTSCNKVFSKEHKLKEHRPGNLECSDCSVSFECKTALRMHQYKHHPIACNECGKVCDSKQQMYFHRLSHAPKFVCKICSKGFLWKSQYTIHMATHTGEKTVICDICGKSFAHKLAVSKHKWQEHNESNKKFKCQTCGKSFVYKGKLESHERSHTGEKPFMCHLCSSSFSQRCNLTAHIKGVHGVYIQSIKSDGTTHTQLVKYKRAKKTAVPLDTQATVVNAVMAPAMEVPVPEQTSVNIQDQVQMSESFETEAAVYQIVYAYPQ